MNILVLETSSSSSKFMVYSTKTNKIDYYIKRFDFDINPNTKINDILKHLFDFYKETSLDKKIDAIIISSTWHSLLICDKEMNPLDVPYYWNNNIATDVVDTLKTNQGFAKHFYEKSGCILHPQYPIFKYKAIKKLNTTNESVRLNDIGSYLYYLLTKRYATSLAMASGSGFVNLKHGKYDKELLNLVGLNNENLPEIIKDEDYSWLSNEGMKLLEVDYKIPVYLPYPDGMLNQIAETYSEGKEMSFSIGTSAALRIFNDKALLSNNQSTWCYNIGKDYLIGGATSGAANHLDWIKNSLFPEQSFEELLNKYESDKIYPVFLPFMFGERSPGWNYKRSAIFEGIKEETTHLDMFFSVMEGIIFNAYQTYNELIKVAGKPDKIRLSGGFIKSQIARNLCANIFNERMIVSDLKQQSLWGGVKLLLNILNLSTPDFELSEQIIKPDNNFKGIYQYKYKLYCQTYERSE